MISTPKVFIPISRRFTLRQCIKLWITPFVQSTLLGADCAVEGVEHFPKLERPECVLTLTDLAYELGSRVARL